MADLNIFKPEHQPNFPLDQENSSSREREGFESDSIESGPTRAKDSESSPANLESADLIKQPAQEVLPNLDQINQLPESQKPLSQEGQEEFLTKLVHADTKESFPKNVAMGTSAAELQDIANEAGTE